MSEWLNEAFSGGVSFQCTNPWGLALIAAAAVLEAAVGHAAKRYPEEPCESIENRAKVAGLLLCGCGAVIASL